MATPCRLIAVTAITLAAALSLAGCRSYHQVVPHGTPVLMADAGTVKTFRPVDVTYSPALSSRRVTNTYLVPDEVRRFDTTNADWAVSFTPEWHTRAAYDAARWVSAGQPADQARWLVSANPVVVALGPNPAGSTPGGVRPISHNDLEQPVSRLVVLDRWLTPPARGPVTAPPPGTRTVDLPAVMTLRQVLHDAPWAARP